MSKNFHVVGYALKDTFNFNHGVSAWICSFIEGMKKHGILSTKILHPRYSKPEKGDLAVIWGIQDTSILNFYKETNTPVISIERGFIPPRSDWSMAGYNGLNGLADFCNKNSTPDRWKKHYQDMLHPWNIEGEYVLLLGQTQGDSALYGLNEANWINECKKYFIDNNIPFMHRPHPGEILVKMAEPPGLHKAIEDSFCVVTYNSSAGVQSILQGKPTISIHPGSMVWEVTKHTLNDCLSAYTPDRTQWAYDFAYTQWNVDEMVKGDTWDHLKTFVE